MRKNIAWSSLLAASTAAVSVISLSFAFRPLHNAPATHLTSVESAYAPFDSIRTDLADYIWPTNAKPKITSSFAEFRSSHFHAGIDIGTNNRIGALVYAVRDGYVARIALSPHGYGRYLVVRHPDGYYTTYAHLSAYQESLERVVRTEQLKEGKFSIEMKFQPADFPVRKGDVIAYSGESGSGNAHLHFEIRDENFNPVNPLLFPNIRHFTDTEPPVFQRLAITPMDEQSFVDYEFAPKIYRARARNKTNFAIAEVIRATGALGFSVDAVDRINNTHYRSSVYTFDFQIDGTTIFTSRRDRFPEGETRQVGVDFDWALWRERKGRFQKLYLDEGNTLPFYEHRNQFDGVVALKNFPEGLHKFKIIASDYSGNSSELTGMFVLNHPPKVEIARGTGESLAAYIPNSASIASVEIGTRTFASSSWKVREIKKNMLAFSNDSLYLPVSKKDADMVRVVARNIWGTRSFPSFYFLRTPRTSSDADITTEVDGSFLEVWLECRAPFTAVPSLQIEQGGTVAPVPLRAINANEYTGVYKLSGTFNGKSHIKAFCEIGGKRSEVFESFDLITVTPEHGGSVQSDDGALSVSFDPGTVFAPLHPTVEKTSDTRYEVQPRDILLRGDVSATMRYQPEKDSDEKLALYVNNGGGWNLTGAERNRQIRAFLLRSGHSLGSFGLLTDQQPPSISRWRSSSTNAKGRPIFSFSVRDNLSGVDEDEINVTLNDERIIPEYDPEKKTVFYIPLDPLPRGRYTAMIEVKDRVGNAAHLTKTLTIYR